jgi:hypothetical protein
VDNNLKKTMEVENTEEDYYMDKRNYQAVNSPELLG